MAEMITVAGVPVYMAIPKEEVKGGLIIIHEVWGLADHIKDVADRYADQGYLVYAPDLLEGTGIEEQATAKLQADLFNPEKRNEVQPKLRAMMAPIQAPEFGEKTVKSLRELFNDLKAKSETKGKVAVMGFCFGGTYSYNLAIAEPDLVCAIPFYGHCDHSVEELKSIVCPIQAFYGEKDEALVTQLPELEEKMRQAEVDFSYQVYTNCGHAFFNDTNPYAYNKEAADDAWKKSLEFLDANFAM